MSSQTKEVKTEEQQMDEAIETLKQKMKLLNYSNLQPPYFLHTLTKFRETHFSRFLKGGQKEGNSDEQKRQRISKVHYLVEHFDDECFDIYSSQLIQPYIRKMFQDNYEFNSINFKEVNTNYHLQTEIQETLTQAAQWLSQIEITQDLLSRVDLYFKIKTPQVLQKLRQQGIKSQKSTWSGSFVSAFKKLLSFGLRKGSKMVQSTFFTAVAPGALMLTLAIMGGTATLPWKTALTPSNLVATAAVVAVPFILDTMASSVEKSDYKEALKRWALTFEALSENISKFNDILEEAIRNCSMAANLNQLEAQTTNLEKIMIELGKSSSTATDFSEEKFEEMRERTWAYFREYLQVKQGDWTLVIPKDEHDNKYQYKSDTNSTEATQMTKISNKTEFQNESFQDIEKL